MLAKGKALALMAILAILNSTVAGTLLVNMAKANYYPPPSIEIYSPAPPSAVYSKSSVPLRVRVNILPSESSITCIRYSLDGKANVTLTSLTREENVWYWTTTEGVFAQGTAFTAKATMDNLADGNHTLIVYAHYANGKEMTSSTEFTVDTHYKPPELVILSPQNQTYTTTEVPLTFTVNKPISFVHCVIDMKLGLNESRFLSGNTTLTGLSNGNHTIKLIVGTEKGIVSQTTYFTININDASTTNNPDPTIPVVAGSIGAIAAVSFGLLVHFKKRKH